MPPPLLRIPYTDPLPLPKIIPASAVTVEGAVAALVEFLSGGRPLHGRRNGDGDDGHGRSATGSGNENATPRARTRPKILLLTGAGISVASGLADYRGPNGTYTLNKTYKPIYYNEFCSSHEARKRYWARSFLGWTTLHKAKANDAHRACGKLGKLGIVENVVTQNVDSFHPLTHPSLPTLELHGYLRSLICLTCHSTYPRSVFQRDLSLLNPTWSTFLISLLTSGALETEDPDARRRMGLKSNPDGDIDVPGAPYSTFRYPACPVCLGRAGGNGTDIKVDQDGAWCPPSTSGILKPAVTMFGESISSSVKIAAEQAVDTADRVLVVGSSLATYSAWRLVKRAKERGMPIGILNMGGVRGEAGFFGEGEGNKEGVRVSVAAEKVLPEVVRILEEEGG